ncbi:hypothetical protein PV10_01701 [Exophiala mesophila]|uniref:DASH complex subunit DAD2 n=1 Tax=Exophiala mesophila TaxID=212818 RepID=A0A0D1ZU08_EXOME|nr:uncharacterized protein PV10_01701 [Exophiala mesophila]KIV98007.1 hypothetical protein PV10_01701 [Exophiala mesophila]
MSYGGPGARSSSAYNPGSSSSSTSASTSHLQARISQKRAELAHLQSLRDSSATLASQLSVLETKLSTLKDGAQSVALVLANWDNVLRAIGMAASQVPQPTATSDPGQEEEGPRDDDETVDQNKVKNKQSEKNTKDSKLPSLPVPLVRIPVQRPDGDGG